MGKLAGQKIAGMGSVGCLWYIRYLLTFHEMVVKTKARPGLWWWIFLFGGSWKKSRSNCWHNMGFSDVRSKVLFVAEWWNENYIELPTENSKHHPLEGIFWQRDVTFIALCYNEQLTEWHATHLLFIQRWIHENSSLTKQERTHVTLDHSKTPIELWEKGRI